MKINPLKNLTHEILWPRKFVRLRYTAILSIWSAVLLQANTVDHTDHVFLFLFQTWAWGKPSRAFALLPAIPISETKSTRYLSIRCRVVTFALSWRVENFDDVVAFPRQPGVLIVSPFPHWWYALQHSLGIGFTRLKSSVISVSSIPSSMQGLLPLEWSKKVECWWRIISLWCSRKCSN